jgi:hypothetical protein
MTPRRPIGVQHGGGELSTLTGSPPCFLLVFWELYMTTRCTPTPFFVAIRIRFNLCLLTCVEAVVPLFLSEQEQNEPMSLSE